MPRYNYAQLEGLWIEGGGSPIAAPVAAAVAMAESSGNSSAESSNPDGGENVGLWQLDTRGKGAGHTIPQLKDPLTNATAAVRGSQNGRDWSAWETFVTGRYRLFLHNNVPPASMAHLTGFNPAGLITGGIAGATGAGSVGGAIGAGTHILEDVSSGAWWRRIGVGAIGGGLILGGVYLMMRKEGIHPVKETVNVGQKVATVAAAVPK